MASTQDTEGGITIPLQYNDAHWKSIFEKYDLDGDGKITYHELRAMIHGSAYTNDIPARVVKMIMHEADLDESGYLDYPEFIAMIHRKDMQGVFGHYAQRYVHCMVPQRRLATQTSQMSRYSGDTIDGQYEEEYSCNPPAIAMVIISLLEIILFLYDAIAYKALTVEGPAAQLFIYHPNKRDQVWRYVTYMFVHVGASFLWYRTREGPNMAEYVYIYERRIFHLVVNLLVQILLGVPLEMVHKWWRVLTIYLAGVIAGSLGTSVSDPHVLLAGASGGVYALMSAHVATIIMNWSQMEYAILQLLVFIVLAVVDVGQAIYNRYVSQAEDQIGYVAHLAGAIAGLLVGINILRNLEVKTWEKAVWWASIITYIVLMTAAILWNIFRP